MCFSAIASAMTPEKDPAVGKPNIPAPKPGQKSVKLPKGPTAPKESPKPKPKPDTDSVGYKVGSAIGNAVSDLQKDVRMGVAVFGKDREAGAAKLSSQGYSKDEIEKYYKRTDETKKLTYPNDPMSNKSYDQPRPAASMMSAPSGGGGGGATTAATDLVVPGSPEDTSGMGEAEKQVAADAAAKTGFAGTVATTPSGLISQAKTTKKKSLMSGLLAS